MIRKADMLNSGDVFPDLEVNLVSGQTFNLAEVTDQDYGVILLYRGHW